ncbi:TPA: trp operon leader peptide [Salmonella enterica subsp. enterica serovar Poona]|nr:trp operon leader peptide [Salmonella enterica]EKB5038302.1 trp operon leader peptide [Salmonella enterica]EME1063158.1 trp operon leader peptide [Salmonella enterica]HEC9413571.1 trp operon leader peptide [Salmonella enterica subsp. enterica serovar Poona]
MATTFALHGWWCTS